MKNVNRVRNPRFALTGRAPRAWDWQARGAGVQWRVEAPADGEQAVMRIDCSDVASEAGWSQQVRCRPKQYFRLEADVRADCHSQIADGGLGVAVRFGRVPHSIDGEVIRLPPLLRSSSRLVLRGYFQVPADARVLELCVGLAGAVGHASVHEVRVIPVFEPDAKDHVLAVPPPGRAYDPPRVARRATICSEAEPPTILARLLRLHLGEDGVTFAARTEAMAADHPSDALLITGRAIPRELRTLPSLERFAQDRIVVISLAAFARIAKGELSVTRIEQEDDPIHASIQCACFITRGFALHDVVPFASAGAAPAAFAQAQLGSKSVARAFCARHGYQVLLGAETDSNRTSGTPIALWKETPGGALIVCDLGPLEVQRSTLGESNPAALLLFNMLGREQTALGQYVTPARDEHQFRGQLADLSAHFPMLHPVGGDPSAHWPAIELGGEAASIGLPHRRRPTLLLRTGLIPGDAEGIYAAMLWLKYLVRPVPFTCPYAAHLNSRFRVMWQPLNRPWTARGIGFQSLGADGPRGPDTPARSADPEWLIDVTVGATHGLAVIFPQCSPLQERCARVLPTLAEAHGRDRFIAHTPSTGAQRGDADACGWRVVDVATEVRVDPRMGDDASTVALIANGVKAVRIELPLPGLGADYASTWRIDLAMLTLDRIVGLMYDTLLANHSAHAIALDSTLIFGESCREYAILSVDAATGETLEDPRMADAGATIRLQPGQALRTLC